MIPDKIYVRIEEMGDVWTLDATTWDNGGEQYIRKDYLLEFMNKKLQESADRLDFHANQAYAEVFDKLNEI